MKKIRTKRIGKITAILLIGTFLCSGFTSVSAVFTDLYAGRDQDVVGNVHVRGYDDHSILVRYTTDSGWTLSETHLAVATSFAGIPQNNKGNPKIGRFPYKADHPEGTITHTYIIDLYDYFPGGGWSGQDLYFAAHAVVNHPDFGEETAWADTWGQYFPGGSIALFFVITLP
jgi:hypothetical protein